MVNKNDSLYFLFGHNLDKQDFHLSNSAVRPNLVWNQRKLFIVYIAINLYYFVRQNWFSFNTNSNIIMFKNVWDLRVVNLFGAKNKM